MKTRLNLLQLTVLFIMVMFAVVHAADVGKDDILAAARKWIADNAVFKAELPDAIPEKATQLADDDGKAMPLWRVDLKPSGYLVMSSDDTLPPVVAFNTKGSFEKTPAGHPLPGMLKRQGAIFKTELEKPKTRGNKLAAENQACWNVLLKRTRAESVTPSEIIKAPMLTTEWNQGAPYNYFCPSGSSYSERAVAGCVPVAVAQLLKYHEWPLYHEWSDDYTDNEGDIQVSMLTDSEYRYNWSAMQDSYEWKEERNYGTAEYEVARLIMELGVLLKADYELDGTGVYIDQNFRNVLSHLGYNATTGLEGTTLYNHIKTDMNEGRPALVSYDGHTFIADGLGTMGGQDYYHFNYGWGGYCNGWYLLTDGYEGTVITGGIVNIKIGISGVPFLKPISEEQTSTFTLEWEMPKRLTADAFSIRKLDLEGDAEWIYVTEELPGTARSYTLTGQSGWCDYSVLAMTAGGSTVGVSNGVTITVKDNPIPMLELTCPESLKSIAGQPVVFTVTGNNDLHLVNMRSNRLDILPYSGVQRTIDGTSCTVTLTPASGMFGNIVVYLIAHDDAGNFVRKAISMAVMPDEPLTWHTTEDEASEAALESGKRVLLVAGRDTCQNTNYFRHTVCETPDVKARLLAEYELWYDNVDAPTGYYNYAFDWDGWLPFIAILDPAQQNRRLRAHSNFMSLEEGRLFLNPDVPYFGLDDSKTYVTGTTQQLDISVMREGTVVYYRLDSNDPTSADTLYTDEIPLTATTTVSARAFLNGQPISDTVTKTYTFMDQVETPVLNKAQVDYFFDSCVVTATCATPGATIRYTTNGYTPTANSPVFPEEGLTVTEYTTIAVKAFKDGMVDSNHASTILTPLELFQDAQGIVVDGDVTMLRGGNAPWTLQRTTYHSSPTAMQSGTITDNQTSVLVAKVTGTGKISFNWKVSSEQNYDLLKISVDGVELGNISGVVDWTAKEYMIEGDGDHYVMWTYMKDVSMSYNDDCGWIDDVSWTPNELKSIAISGNATVSSGSTATYTCTATWGDGTTSTVTPTWSLSATTYAAVDEDGVVTNQNTTTSNKTVTLTAAYMGKTATKSITLAKKNPVSIEISGPDSIASGETATYTCNVVWSYGPASTVTSPTWSLDANDYASLEANGVVKNNNTTPRPLTARLNVVHTVNNQQLTASKTITLKPVETPALTAIDISGPVSISFAGTAAYTCTATWSDQTTTTVTPIWTVSATAIASVDANGVVTNNNTAVENKSVRLNAVYEANGVIKMTSKSITLEGGTIQTLALQPGWNWVSFYLLPPDNTVGNVLGAAGFTANDVVQTDGDSARFTGAGWFMENFRVEFGKSYKIYVDKAVTVNIAGNPSGLSSIPLNSGWNWIGNPTGEAVPISGVSHSGGWTENDRIQTSGSSAMFTGNSWVPAGFMLEPGKGYQIYSANDGALAFPSEEDDDELYVVVNLSGGPNASSYPVRYTAIEPDPSDDICRTTELWLRKIPAGTFVMGSPEDEVGRDEDETQHEVTLTQDYYIGVFECTQKQWELVMGSNPSEYTGDCRPAGGSYDMIRGTSATSGAGWPNYGHTVDATSFMGKLQEKTGLVFDLPTEAQWEYACRAGTTTALNSGKNLTSTTEDAAMAEVGRYWYNGGSSSTQSGATDNGTAKVGSYLPNAWGLYDMHGNVLEWCLDWSEGSDYSASPVTDPVGPTAGSNRVVRGGYWQSIASRCRSAFRSESTPSGNYSYIGFRVACHQDKGKYAVVDLSGGVRASSYPVRYTDVAPDLNGDTCRTTELWLRKIPKGTFTMGSPEDEVGHLGNESQHEVTLTQDYYIGVFECTQRQWELVMGNNPAWFIGDVRPVDQVSYDMIRGTFATAGGGWPEYGHVVDASSFMGILQAKTGLTFDLPTRAQWEYACRAGTTTALNSGKNLLVETGVDANLNEVGRYDSNLDDGKGGYSEHTKVGSYLPNAWGLYDMHGNVEEWCLDIAADNQDYHVLCGGSFYGAAFVCRSACANNCFSAAGNPFFGFRMVLCLP